VGRGTSRKNYTTALKNGIKSRKVIGYNGYSLKPQTVQWLTTMGDKDDLYEFAARMCNALPSKRIKLDPINVKKNTKIPETSIIFNLNNEPSFKYSLMSIADKSIESKVLTSCIMKSRALYLETQDNKYELSIQDNSEENDIFVEYDCYRLTRVLNPQQVDNEFLEKNSVPLAEQHVEVLFKDLDWTDIKWGTDAILIKGQEFKKILNYKYFNYHKKDDKQKDVVLIE